MKDYIYSYEPFHIRAFWRISQGCQWYDFTKTWPIFQKCLPKGYQSASQKDTRSKESWYVLFFFFFLQQSSVKKPTIWAMFEAVPFLPPFNCKTPSKQCSQQIQIVKIWKETLDWISFTPQLLSLIVTEDKKQGATPSFPHSSTQNVLITNHEFLRRQTHKSLTEYNPGTVSNERLAWQAEHPCNPSSNALFNYFKNYIKE